MSRPFASVVVPTWNGVRLIEACLGSVFAQDYPEFEVVVVDNASADGTADLVAEAFPQARLLRQARNLGFAGGTNAGCRAASGELLALLNQDAVVERDWLARLQEAAADPAVGVVGSKSLFPDGRTVQMAGGSIGWPLGTVTLRGQYETDGPEVEAAGGVDFVSGCGMAFGRRLLEAVGGLDEAFWPGYYEDVDLCVRARRAGLACRYAPLARLRHAESSSFRAWRSTWRFHHRGRLHFVLKHTPPAEVIERFLPTEELYQRALLALLPGATLARAYVETVRRSLPGLRADGHLDAAAEREIGAGLLRLAERARDGGGAAAAGLPPGIPRECLGIAFEEAGAHLSHAVRHLRFRLQRLADSERLAAEAAELRLTLEARTGELEAALRELASVRRTRQREIEAHRDELASQRGLAAAREREIAEFAAQLASVREVLAARDEEIQALYRQADARDGALADLRLEYDRLRQSFFGKVAMRLRRWRGEEA